MGTLLKHMRKKQSSNDENIPTMGYFKGELEMHRWDEGIKICLCTENGVVGGLINNVGKANPNGEIK